MLRVFGILALCLGSHGLRYGGFSISGFMVSVFKLFYVRYVVNADDGATVKRLMSPG